MEAVFDELKTHLLQRRRVRRKTADWVRQEFYGWVRAHTTAVLRETSRPTSRRNYLHRCKYPQGKYMRKISNGTVLPQMADLELRGRAAGHRVA